VAKKYEVVMKKLVERDPAAWLASLGIETDGPIGIVDADLSKITSEADRIVLVESSEPHLVHMEFHSARDLELAERLLINNVNIGFELKRRVESHAILLHPSVDSSELTGLFRKATPDGDPVLAFYYRIVRAWTLPVEPLLTGDRRRKHGVGDHSTRRFSAFERDRAVDCAYDHGDDTRFGGSSTGRKDDPAFSRDS
jgi:hypothetical protein